MRPAPISRSGFTLIELSIVLIVIGLVVGGILVGQSLIAAAAVRATISQIEKYNTAVNTFRTKYNNQVPGDISATDAAQFGFAARGAFAGEGDGNGVIEGNYNNGLAHNGGHLVSSGEGLMFWVDLSTAGLIEGGFNTATAITVVPAMTSSATTPSIAPYLPAAKIGSNNYIYVWSGGLASGNGINYFELSAIKYMNNPGDGTGTITGRAGLTVLQASAIDTKIDDGLPQAGRVLAIVLVGAPQWTGPPYGAAWASGIIAVPYTSAVSPSSTTCFDNGGGSTPQAYSLATNGGVGVNCALSFQFQ